MSPERPSHVSSRPLVSGSDLAAIDAHDAAAGTPAWVIGAAGRFSGRGGLLAGWWDDLERSPRIAWRLFLRHLVNQYRQSSLGIVLALAPVTLTVLVFVVGRRADVLSGEIGGVNSAFYGAFGVLLLQTFVEAFGSMLRLFSGNQMLLRRQNLAIEPLIVAELIDFVFLGVVKVVVIAAMMTAFGIGPTPWSPLLLWAVLGVSLAGGAFGLLTAPLAGLTNDLQVLSRVLGFLVAGFTPVFIMPAAGTMLHRVQHANPLTWLFDGARAIAYGGSGSVAAGLLAPLAAAVLLLAGWLLCRIARPHVVERMIGAGA